MKETQTPIPWQVDKSKIEEYTTSKWKHKWITAPSIITQNFFMTHPIKRIKIHLKNGYIHAKYMDQKYNRAQ